MLESIKNQSNKNNGLSSRLLTNLDLCSLTGDQVVAVHGGHHSVLVNDGLPVNRLVKVTCNA